MFPTTPASHRPLDRRPRRNRPRFSESASRDVRAGPAGAVRGRFDLGASREHVRDSRLFSEFPKPRAPRAMNWEARSRHRTSLVVQSAELR